MIDFDMQDTDSEYYSEDESETEVIIAHNYFFYINENCNAHFNLYSQLQEAFARGDLKPGLNVEYQKPKEKVNNIVSLK